MNKIRFNFLRKFALLWPPRINKDVVYLVLFRFSLFNNEMFVTSRYVTIPS